MLRSCSCCMEAQLFRHPPAQLQAGRPLLPLTGDAGFKGPASVFMCVLTLTDVLCASWNLQSRGTPSTAQPLVESALMVQNMLDIRAMLMGVAAAARNLAWYAGSCACCFSASSLASR